MTYWLTQTVKLVPLPTFLWSNNFSWVKYRFHNLVYLNVWGDVVRPMTFRHRLRCLRWRKIFGVRSDYILLYYYCSCLTQLITDRMIYYYIQAYSNRGHSSLIPICSTVFLFCLLQFPLSITLPFTATLRIDDLRWVVTYPILCRSYGLICTQECTIFLPT